MKEKASWAGPRGEWGIYYWDRIRGYDGVHSKVAIARATPACKNRDSQCGCDDS